jgi:hypothetical protein
VEAQSHKDRQPPQDTFYSIVAEGMTMVTSFCFAAILQNVLERSGGIDLTPQRHTERRLTMIPKRITWEMLATSLL